MPVETTLFVPKTNGTSWKEVRGADSTAHSHAERRVFDEVTHANETFFLLVQNAAPCGQCNTWLSNKSKGGRIIVVRYTAAHGGYGNAQGGIEFFHNGNHVGGTRPNALPVALFNNINNHL
ncbi:MAG: hypothetical protein HC846_09300 [Blastocatellia bacterium]|nr:hypothetical protein [Blastocatellia bacterium]